MAEGATKRVCVAEDATKRPDSLPATHVTSSYILCHIIIHTTLPATQRSQPSARQSIDSRLHYRLLTLCPAPTDPVSQSWPRGTGSVGDSVGEGASEGRRQAVTGGRKTTTCWRELRQVFILLNLFIIYFQFYSV